MMRRGLLWFAMVAALFAAPAFAQTQPDQPKAPGAVEKGRDSDSKAQPHKTQTKPPVCRRACSKSSSGRVTPTQ
jgi:hypothetical protein